MILLSLLELFTMMVVTILHVVINTQYIILPLHPEISVQFNPTSYTVAEGGNIELVVTKTGTADEEVTVTLTTQDGSAGSKRLTSKLRSILTRMRHLWAINSYAYICILFFVSIELNRSGFFLTDSDYTGKTVQLTFAPGETNKRVTIQTTADNVLEGTEKLSAVLTSPSDRVTITEDTADISIVESGSGEYYTVVILEDIFQTSVNLFTNAVLVEFDPTSYTVNEEDRVVLFTIVKRTPTTQPVTVQFTTQDGSATCM